MPTCRVCGQPSLGLVCFDCLPPPNLRAPKFNPNAVSRKIGVSPLEAFALRLCLPAKMRRMEKRAKRIKEELTPIADKLDERQRLQLNQPGRVERKLRAAVWQLRGPHSV